MVIIKEMHYHAVDMFKRYNYVKPFEERWRALMSHALHEYFLCCFLFIEKTQKIQAHASLVQMKEYKVNSGTFSET